MLGFNPDTWLTDASVKLVTDYFNEILEERHLGNSVKIIDPSVSNALGNLAQGDQSLGVCSSSPEWESNYVILFPINNGLADNAGDGGSHWSLLIAVRESLSRPISFWYFDSAAGS